MNTLEYDFRKVCRCTAEEELLRASGAKHWLDAMYEVWDDLRFTDDDGRNRMDADDERFAQYLTRLREWLVDVDHYIHAFGTCPDVCTGSEFGAGA